MEIAIGLVEQDQEKITSFDEFMQGKRKNGGIKVQGILLRKKNPASHLEGPGE